MGPTAEAIHLLQKHIFLRKVKRFNSGQHVIVVWYIFSQVIGQCHYIVLASGEFGACERHSHIISPALHLHNGPNGPKEQRGPLPKIKLG